MLRKRLSVALGAELVQELGRALDVREKERDGARRKVVPHVPVIMRRFLRRVQWLGAT